MAIMETLVIIILYAYFIKHGYDVLDPKTFIGSLFNDNTPDVEAIYYEDMYTRLIIRAGSLFLAAFVSPLFLLVTIVTIIYPRDEYN